MPVGDVERGERIDGAGEGADRRLVGDGPHLVADAVGPGDVDLGRTACRFGEDRVDLRRLRIGHHHRPGLGVDCLDLADAVVLLHRRGQLVLADATGAVVGERGDARKPGLGAALAGQPIDVVAGRRVADEDAIGDHAPEVLCRLGVDRVGVGIDVGRKVDLGLRDMEETPGLAPRLDPRLVARQHVIGRREYLGRPPRRGAEGTKRSDQGQGNVSGGYSGRPVLVGARAGFNRRGVRRGGHWTLPMKINTSGATSPTPARLPWASDRISSRRVRRPPRRASRPTRSARSTSRPTATGGRRPSARSRIFRSAASACPSRSSARSASSSAPRRRSTWISAGSTRRSARRSSRRPTR